MTPPLDPCPLVKPHILMWVNQEPYFYYVFYDDCNLLIYLSWNPLPQWMDNECLPQIKSIKSVKKSTCSNLFLVWLGSRTSYKLTTWLKSTDIYRHSLSLKAQTKKKTWNSEKLLFLHLQTTQVSYQISQFGDCV